MRLLRFLEERSIRPIGSLKETPVDCRVIAATNANLVDAIREGRFREDLYYRLRVVTMTIPPLRRRREDIPELAAFLVDNFCRQKDLPRVKILSDTTKKLLDYTWPGNVRELRNTLEAAVALCPADRLRPEDIRIPEAHELPLAEELPEASFSLEEGERQIIIRALKETGGVQKTAAELLGISRRAIHYKIKKYGIDPASLR
jgi:DNA-binding NtrC family response regulator